VPESVYYVAATCTCLHFLFYIVAAIGISKDTVHMNGKKHNKIIPCDDGVP